MSEILNRKVIFLKFFYSEFKGMNKEQAEKYYHKKLEENGINIKVFHCDRFPLKDGSGFQVMQAVRTWEEMKNFEKNILPTMI